VQDGDHWQQYGLLIASRWPLTPLDISLDGMPTQRWLSVRVERETPLLLGGVYVPNRDEFGGVKYAALDALVALANAHRDEPMIIVGDFNTGRIGLDETSRYFDEREDAFMRAMEHADWASALRLVHGDTPHASYWHAQSGNGFLIDHAFVAPTLAPQVAGCTLDHEPSVWPSDHAALMVDLTR
jgi:exonuclease III